MVSVMWFRRDLRVEDQKALARAIASQSPTLCVFQFNQEQLSQPPSRNQSAVVASVLAFKEELKEKGIDLYVMHGDLITCFEQLAQQLAQWTDVYFNYDESGFGRRRDQQAAQWFRAKKINIHAYQDHYLHGSQEIKNQSGQYYKIFTPYYRVWQCLPKETPVVVDLSRGNWLSLKIPQATLELIETLKDTTFNDVMTVKEAKERLNHFVDNQLADYDTTRDFPSRCGTSFLSPYLRLGMVSIRTVYQAVSQAPASSGQAVFLKELAWRDFYHMVYVANPNQKKLAIQEAFRHLEWDENPAAFKAWKEGQTGYPIIDAAMKQLLATGWMHNRLRMVVASFLTKDLQIDWRLGEAYFQEQLIDYDAASNIGGWQWAASVGTDAVPYFRIFNPVTQGKRFDPDGEFIRSYLPSLVSVPQTYLYEPWKMPEALQESIACIIGEDYPHPLVDHAEQRKRAIARYEWAKEKAQMQEERLH
ncbi:deoxyribodipyrimidine photo-lyase [Streptococcus dysgalactiae subsp. equisimilis]